VVCPAGRPEVLHYSIHTISFKILYYRLHKGPPLGPILRLLAVVTPGVCLRALLWNYAISCHQTKCESLAYLTPLKRPGAHWVHDGDGMCEVSAGSRTPATVMVQSLEWFHKGISKHATSH